MEYMRDGEYPIDYHALTGKYVPHFVPAKETPPAKCVDGVTVVKNAIASSPLSSGEKEEIIRVFRGHPQATISPVFPMSVIGLKDRGTVLFDAAVTTAKTIRSSKLSVCGWDPEPIVLARLGLVEELDTYLYDFPSNWQFYNNGFMHYGPVNGMFADANLPFRRGRVSDADRKGEFYRAETFPFRHMGLEPLGVFSAAMNERLMQSFDGVIRIAPAYGKRSAKFKLHAVGGFEVMAQIKDGEAEFVAIRSRFGNPLTLENPWQTAYCGGESYSQKEICLETEAGMTYVFTSTPDAAFASEIQTPAANSAPKIRPDRFAMLGTERSF